MGQGIFWVEATASSRPGSVLAALRAAPAAAARVGGAGDPPVAGAGRGAPRSAVDRGMLATPAVRMVWAESASGAYPAAVGEGAIGLLRGAAEVLPGDLPARTFCIADSEALSHHSRLLPRREATVEVEGAESSKTIAEAERVLRRLAVRSVRRDDCVLAFGGGVIETSRASAPRPTSGASPWSRRPPRSSRRWTPPTGERRGWIYRRRRTTSAPTTCRSRCSQIRPPSRPCRGTSSRRASWRW